MPDIVTVTLNPALDKSAAVEHVLANEKLQAEAPQFDPGGGGINVARAASRLGADVLAVWVQGGHTGQLLEHLLEQEGVSQRTVPIAAWTRENLTITERASGDQYRFGMPGAEVTEEELAGCVRAVQEVEPAAAYVVFSGSLPPGIGEDGYARFARELPAESRVVLDCKGPAMTAGATTQPFLVKPNVGELEEMVGWEIHSDEDVEQAARSVVEQYGVENVLVSLGSGGAVLVTATERIDVRAPTVKVRSRVGAGDSTVGGLVAALCRGIELPEAVRYGVAAGAAAVMTPGTELCRREDVERILERMGEPS